MKKPIVLRILLLLLFYAAVFTVVVLIQFNKRGSFTRKVGDFIVSGQYREREENERAPEGGEYLLTGKASVVFGGVEFLLGPAAEGSGSGLRYSVFGGDTVEITPLSMVVSEPSADDSPEASAQGSVLFRLSGGTTLTFSSLYSGGAGELRISCAFPGDEVEANAEEETVELPYRLMRRTVLKEAEDGRGVLFTSDGGSYSFGQFPVDVSLGLLFFRSGNASVIYRAVPDERDFNPAAFVLPAAESVRGYAETLTGWIDRNFSRWSRNVAGGNDEDIVIALAAESINRGTYRTAVSSVPQGFLNGNMKTFRSSVYLGGLGEAYLSLSGEELERRNALSRLLNENSPDFFLEPHVLEYLAVRGRGDFLEAGAELIRSIAPEDITLALCPGILEAHADWKTLRPLEENPFERPIEEACFVVSGSLRRFSGTSSGDKVFSSFENRVDIRFNIRLGKALLAWAQSAGEESWAALARSLILSSVPEGTEPLRAVYNITEEGVLAEDEASPMLSPAGVYPLLRTGTNYPRAVSIGTAGGIWAWTAASGVSMTRENNVTDIAVTFPAGETHYMIIRGIRAFQRIQLYGMDFRTDPQFERYDSSGWSYIPAEQVLLVKMKHRTAVEHIRIYY